VEAIVDETAAPAPAPPGDEPAEPRPNPKRLLLRWSLVATALALGYLLWQCGSAMTIGGRLSDAGVQHIHAQLDSAAYEAIVREADPLFQKAESHERLIKFLTGVHSKLGTSRGCTRNNIFVKAGTNGTFITTQYKSTFAHGDAVESFTWREAAGRLKLAGYHIESDAFVTP
jgi:hypothetical protein